MSSSKTVHIGFHNLLKSEVSGGDGGHDSGSGGYSGSSMKGKVNVKGKSGRGKKPSIEFKKKGKGGK